MTNELIGAMARALQVSGGLRDPWPSLPRWLQSEYKDAARAALAAAKSAGYRLVPVDDPLSSETVELPEETQDEKKLPLMARPAGILGTHAFVHPNGWHWGTWVPSRGEVLAQRYRDRGWTEYRLVIHDEHGLPVIPYTADMPEDAKYAYDVENAYGLGKRRTFYIAHYSPDGVAINWQRIEDYRPAQPGGADE